MNHPLDICVCGDLLKDHHENGCDGLIDPERNGACSCSLADFQSKTNQSFNSEAYADLIDHEIVYLRANGWDFVEQKWTNEGLHRHGIEHGHAVNIQKQRDRISSKPL
jgi:hypothetical protein